MPASRSRQWGQHNTYEGCHSWQPTAREPAHACFADTPFSPCILNISQRQGRNHFLNFISLLVWSLYPGTQMEDNSDKAPGNVLSPSLCNSIQVSAYWLLFALEWGLSWAASQSSVAFPISCLIFSDTGQNPRMDPTENLARARLY